LTRSARVWDARCLRHFTTRGREDAREGEDRDAATALEPRLSAHAQQVLALQRTVGNAAVAQTLGSPKVLRQAPPAPTATAAPAPAAQPAAGTPAAKPSDLTEAEAIPEIPKMDQTVRSGGVGINKERLDNTDEQKHFLRAGRAFFGSNRATIDWFKAIRKVVAPGNLFLHESAAARLEAVATRLGSDMPKSTIGYAVRAPFSAKTTFSARDHHMMGLAIDYDAVDNPRLTRPSSPTLVQAVTGEASSAQLGRGARKTILAMGKAAAAGEDVDKTVTGASGVLTKIESEAKRLADVSDDFQQSLGAGREKFLELQGKYLAAKDKQAQDEVMAQVIAVIKPWLDAVEKAAKDIADAAAAAGLDPNNLPTQAEVKAMIRAAVGAKNDADRLAKKYKAKEPDPNKNAADIAKIVDHEAKLKVTPKEGVPFATRCADLATRADEQGSLLGPVADAKFRTLKLKAVKVDLAKPEFLFGTSTKQAVSAPSMAQLVEHGYFNPEDPDPKSTSQVNFNGKFIQEMAREGFFPGFAFGGESTDSMHFEFVIDKTAY
jgi:hypothetical protein